VSKLALRVDARLAEIVRRLADDLHPTRIYLFGSRARDQAAEDSDYDLMVLVAASDQPPHRRAQQAYGALWGVGAPVDVLVWTEAEFDRQVPVIASLPAEVVHEGQLVYAA
jgi:predicted nucleotidyltransferase